MWNTKNHFYEGTRKLRFFSDEILLSEAKSHFSKVMRKLQKYIFFFYKANVTTPKNLEKKKAAKNTKETLGCDLESFAVAIPLSDIKQRKKSHHSDRDA